MNSLYYSLSRRDGAILTIPRKIFQFLLIFTLLLMAMKPVMAANASITKSSYGTTANGKAVDEYTLTNTNGAEVKIITYGGIITSLGIPDRNGNIGNVVLGFDKLGDYETKNP